jgi:hypothetical protein
MALQPLGTLVTNVFATTDPLQRSHWYVIVGVGTPVGVAVTVNVWPWPAVPVICGALGKTGATSALEITADEAAMEVATFPFDAVAITVTYFPVSPATVV